MTSKKFLSVVLSVLFVLTSALSVSAAQATAEIGEPHQSVFNLTVDVTTTAEGKMTAKLTNEANNRLVGIAEQTEYRTQDGKNVYTFQFKLQLTDATGVYTISVGSNVVAEPKNFKIINAAEMVAFFNELNVAEITENPETGAVTDGIYNLMAGENSKSTYDVTDYKTLTPEIRLQVSEIIEALDLAAALDYSNIEAVEERFTQAMDEAMMLAKIADDASSVEKWDAAVRDLICAEQPEGEEVEKTPEETFYAELTPSNVKGYYAVGNQGVITRETVTKTLDKAIVLATAKELDDGYLSTVIDHYMDKGGVLTTVNASDYNAVKSKGLANDVFEALKKANNSSITSLQANLNQIMRTALEGYTPDEGGINERPSTTPTRPATPGPGTVVSGEREEPKEEPKYETNFADLGQAEWARVAIVGLAEKGIVSGRGDGKFYPNDGMTREEFVKLIVSAFDVYDESATASFGDVAQERWSYGYVASAARLGLVTGADNASFNPGGSITREDMAVIIYRMYDYLSLGDVGATLNFKDASSVSGYAKNAVAELAGRNIINGMGDGTFAPKGLVTRAQAAKVVYELLALIGGVN